MEDKKVLEFINKNHERSYIDFVKSQKKKNKKETLKITTGVVIVLVLIITLGITVHNDTKKQVEKCLKNGNSQSYCLYKANN
jgi:preprotein translocase subunit SecG